MWVPGLPGNNLENINNVVSLTTEHAICPFHLAGDRRKGLAPIFTEVLQQFLSYIRYLTFKFRNQQLSFRWGASEISRGAGWVRTFLGSKISLWARTSAGRFWQHTFLLWPSLYSYRMKTIVPPLKIELRALDNEGVSMYNLTWFRG